MKTDRDFIGRRALAEAPIKRQLVGLILLDRGVLRSHQKVATSSEKGDGEGEITSGGFSPTLDKSIALARLPLEATAGDEVHVIVRDKMLRAKVVKYPFVRNGKVLV
jgi:aminomethyltransferase